MANSIASTKNCTTIPDEAHKRAGRNAKGIITSKIEVPGLGDHMRNVDYKTGSIIYESETKTFDYDRGIKLFADMMGNEEAGVLSCFVTADSELQCTQMAPEADPLHLLRNCRARGRDRLQERPLGFPTRTERCRKGGF